MTNRRNQYNNISHSGKTVTLASVNADLFFFSPVTMKSLPNTFRRRRLKEKGKKKKSGSTDFKKKKKTKIQTFSL